MSTPLAIWLHEAANQLEASLDLEYPAAGKPMTEECRAQLYGLVRDLREQRDAEQRRHACDPKVIAMPPPGLRVAYSRNNTPGAA